MITDKQITALRTAAAEHGDHHMVLVCDVALGSVDPDDGYDHLRIWSFLDAGAKRAVSEVATQEQAREQCAAAVLEAAAQTGEVL